MLARLNYIDKHRPAMSKLGNTQTTVVFTFEEQAPAGAAAGAAVENGIRSTDPDGSTSTATAAADGAATDGKSTSKLPSGWEERGKYTTQRPARP